MYSVFCLVVHQRIYIFPAEPLLRLMMLDPNFSSKPVSMFNALFSKMFGNIVNQGQFLIVSPVFLMFFRIHLSPGDARKEVGGIGRVSV